MTAYKTGDVLLVNGWSSRPIVWVVLSDDSAKFKKLKIVVATILNEDGVVCQSSAHIRNVQLVQSADDMLIKEHEEGHRPPGAP